MPVFPGVHEESNYDGHLSRGGAGMRIDDEYTRTVRHACFAAVSYVDAQVGRVLDELDRLGLRESTIVVVWGDHGWHLGDHTIWGKHTTFERSLRSPLIIRAPQITAPGRRTEDIVESVDIYPTLVELAGLKPPEGLSGTSLAGRPSRSFIPGKGRSMGVLSRPHDSAHRLLPHHRARFGGAPDRAVRPPRGPL